VLDGQPAGGIWTLVVTDVAGGSVGAIADWSLCLGVESGAELDCPASSIASQPPLDTLGVWSAVRANTNDGRNESFSGVDNPITAVTWWGYFAKDEGGGIFSACEPSLLSYNVELRTPELQVVERLSRAPLVESTGQVVELNGVTVPVLRHWVSVPNALLSEGLLFVGNGSDEGCDFYWLGSATGDGAHFEDDVSTPGDLSFCIIAPEPASLHAADQNNDNAINLSELLRVIQLYNATLFGCENGTEDGYAPGDSDTGCLPHASDYNPPDWRISLSELLRLIQLFNLGGYAYCPSGGTEDGFCPAP
jgi:hypothetical protein